MARQLAETSTDRDSVSENTQCSDVRKEPQPAVDNSPGMSSTCDANKQQEETRSRPATRVRRLEGGGPRIVVSTAAFHARVRGSVPGLGGLKETKMFLPHPRVKVSIVGSLRDREVACSASDR